MTKLISLLSVVPLRAENRHQSEQVSQLLFGETATLISKSKEWIKIKCDIDNYEGWLLKSTSRDYRKRLYRN
jgi:hypothetical protein